MNVGPPFSVISAAGPTPPRLGDWKKGRPRKAPGSPHPQLQPRLVQIRCKGLPLGFQTYRGLHLTSGFRVSDVIGLGGRRDRGPAEVGAEGATWFLSPGRNQGRETTSPDAPRPSCCPFLEGHPSPALGPSRSVSLLSESGTVPPPSLTTPILTACVAGSDVGCAHLNAPSLPSCTVCRGCRRRALPQPHGSLAPQLLPRGVACSVF